MLTVAFTVPWLTITNGVVHPLIPEVHGRKTSLAPNRETSYEPSPAPNWSTMTEMGSSDSRTPEPSVPAALGVLSLNTKLEAPGLITNELFPTKDPVDAS